jgi:xanthine dehydrogenase accessory factor
MKQTDFASIVSTMTNRREPFAVATVVKIEGSTIGKPGFKVIISKAGEVIYGSLGGVCPDSAIVEVAKKAMETGEPRTVKVYLESVENAVEGVVKSRTDDEIHVETNCGGTMEIYVEPYLAQLRLIVIGQGGKDEVEDGIVRFGKMLDFEVIVIDHSPAISEEPDELISDLDFDLSKFKFYASDSVIILTRGERDVETLTAVLPQGLRYVGLMASRIRAKEDAAELLRRGFDPSIIQTIHSPVGLDIGSKTPTEIALSIMSEVVATKYEKKLTSKSLKPEDFKSPVGNEQKA